MERGLTARQRWELQLYEKLGMRRFRDLLFRYERFHHRKRGGYYPPYHLAERSAGGAQTFVKQLKSNAWRHAVSLGLCLLFLLSNALGGRNGLLALAAWLGCAGNGLCIALQRYNYLRIRRVAEKAARCRNRRGVEDHEQ